MPNLRVPSRPASELVEVPGVGLVPNDEDAGSFQSAPVEEEPTGPALEESD